jgi:HTH-type transcriptional regulator, glycine betaine synthesis regulator
MPTKLDSRQRQFIEEFGNLYASYGLKRISGMMIGLLLSSDGPLSLDEICHHLRRSKGAISETTRRLNALGYIKKIEGPESRKDYYIADHDIFINVFHFNMATVRKNLAIADQFQHLLEGTNARSHTRWRENLRVMMGFYQLMSEFYEGFDGRWSDHKKTLMNP